VIRHLTASGVVLSADGRVLLVEHRKLGCWIYPGGHVCPNEDPAEAVVREVAEETGITGQIVAESRFSHPGMTVLPVPFTILVLDVPADTGVGPHQHIDMVYVLAPRSGLLVPQDEEVSRCAWVPVADVAGFDTPPELPALIVKAAAYVRAVGSPACRLAPSCVG